MLFVLGGNGTHAGANAIHNEVVKRVFIYKLVSRSFISLKQVHSKAHFLE